MKKILFLDFEDSFTHNLVQSLIRPDVEVQVLNWKEFRTGLQSDLLVLGPGPGHPEDYQQIFPALRDWIERERPVFGVCLGHQLFWLLRGAQIVRSTQPKHGQKEKINPDQNWREWPELPAQWEVQRYNSLVVTSPSVISEGESLVFQGSELQASRGKTFLTYQFHPESVGTKCREAFFRPVFQLLL